jgi:hypothetical protein
MVINQYETVQVFTDPVGPQKLFPTFTLEGCEGKISFRISPDDPLDTPVAKGAIPIKQKDGTHDHHNLSAFPQSTRSFIYQ